MTKEEFLVLYEKCRREQCTLEEQELLDLYSDGLDLLDNNWEGELGDKEIIGDRIWNRLHKENGNKGYKMLNKRIIARCMKAAVIILIPLAGFLYFREKKAANQLKNKLSAIKNNSKSSGFNKAYLITSNGSKIVLSNIQNGSLTRQSGIRVTKENDSVLVYHIDAKAGDASNELAKQYNTIATPIGGQYQLVLEDGSKVWLNSASTFRFPVAFGKSERRVELSGEAYFEVAKNKAKPFIVEANGTSIQVLGTHFNINAYTNNDNVTTTLLEGSVRMVKGDATVKLLPGQQGTTFSGDKGIKVKEADIEENMGWKNGLFVFHDESIINIMKQVSRWYDVDIQYSGEAVKENEFGGTISKYKTVDELLSNMKLTGAIHYKIEGRRVLISK